MRVAGYRSCEELIALSHLVLAVRRGDDSYSCSRSSESSIPEGIRPFGRNPGMGTKVPPFERSSAHSSPNIPRGSAQMNGLVDRGMHRQHRENPRQTAGQSATAGEYDTFRALTAQHPNFTEGADSISAFTGQ